MSVGERPLTLKDRLRKNYVYLVDELFVSNYLNDLYEVKVLSDQDKEQLTGETARRKQAELFVDILMRKPESGIQKFLDIVKTQKDKQPQIYERLFPRHAYTEQRDAAPQRDNPGSPVTVTAEGTDCEWEELLIPRLPSVVAALRPSLLLDHLRAARLVTATEYKHLQHRSLSEKERSRKLLNSILPDKGKGSFWKFCRVLYTVEGQQHILTEIMKVASAMPPDEDITVISVDTVPDASVKETLTVPREDARQPAFTDPEQASALIKGPETAVTPCAARKLRQSHGGCPSANSTRRDCATFFLKPEHRQLIKPIQNVISSLCVECFEIEQEMVMFTSVPMADVKTMLKMWGYSCYLDVDSKLAVLWLDGIKPHQVDNRCERLERLIVTHLRKVSPHLELPAGECSVLEIICSSSFVVLLLGIDLYLSLLCILGKRESRMGLAKLLQEVLPESRKAVLRLGGLPPVELFSGLTGARSHEHNGSFPAGVGDRDEDVAETQISVQREMISSKKTDDQGDYELF